VNKSHLTALSIFAAVVLLFTLGTLLKSGAAPAPTDTSDEDRRFEVVVREIAAEPRPATLALRGRTEAFREVMVRAETGGRVEDIEAARAALSASEATHRLAERRLADADLKAPSDGIILTRVREPGAIVNAGETIYTLSLNSPIWVRTYVSEPDLGRIRPGMTAEVRTDSGGVYKGQVGFISPVAEFTPKTVETRELRTALVYRLRIIVDNPDGGLRQGMPVTVTLEAAHSS